MYPQKIVSLDDLLTKSGVELFTENLFIVLTGARGILRSLCQGCQDRLGVTFEGELPPREFEALQAHRASGSCSSVQLAALLHGQGLTKLRGFAPFMQSQSPTELDKNDRLWLDDSAVRALMHYVLLFLTSTSVDKLAPFGER